METVLQPWAGLLIGLLAGFVYVGASKLVSHVLKVDDPLDAAAVHGFTGAWGLIAAALFAHEPNVALAYADMPAGNYGAPLLAARCRHVPCGWSGIPYLSAATSICAE